MNHDDFNLLLAGPEMDEIIAEKVMKWVKVQSGTDPETHGAPYYAWRDQAGKQKAWAISWYQWEAWSPSTKIADAWSVVDFLCKEGMGTTLMTRGAFTDEGLGPAGKFSASMRREHSHEARGYGCGDDMMIAICRAAFRTTIKEDS